MSTPKYVTPQEQLMEEIRDKTGKKDFLKKIPGGMPEPKVHLCKSRGFCSSVAAKKGPWPVNSSLRAFLCLAERALVLK